jgi:hypothetical protein
MRAFAIAVLAVSQVVEGTHISDDFSTLSSKWIASLAEGEDANALYPGRFTVVNSGEDNTALTMAEPGKYALTQKLDQQITFDDKPLVVQYDVTYPEPVTCGGSYIKLLSGQDVEFEASTVDDKTPYTIMFGPDKCGMDAKYHFIFRYKNPKSGSFREVHARKVADAKTLLFSDKKSHLVTLVIKPDSTFVMKVDMKPTLSGVLGSGDEFDPQLSPPKTIDDPDDAKPEDWVD